jgi:hypothetical protein
MPRKPAFDDPTPMFKDYIAGMRLNDVSLKYGVSDTTIQKYLNAGGIKRRSPWRPRRCGKRFNYLKHIEGVYGLPMPEFLSLYRKQRGRCAICMSRIRCRNGDTRATICVDHDHASGRVRGLLCTSCNNGLGMFKDRADLIRTAYFYISGVL